MPQLAPWMLEGFPQNGPTDPIEYYRKPVVGHLFLRRINMGLALLPERRVNRLLEVGYGAGALLSVLAPTASDVHGIDLDADPEAVTRTLAKRGHRVRLTRGSVYELPYPDGHFDRVVCFSVFEHLPEFEQGLREVARVLAPGGHFLLGMPAVNRAMEVGFRMIGFKNIDDHHVTKPQTVARAFASTGFAIECKRYLGLQVNHLALYYTWLLRRS